MTTREVFIDKLKAHAKIRRDMEVAYTLLSLLKHETDDVIVALGNEAGFTTAVICYARSFTKTNGALIYPLTDLKSHADFDQEIHDHLVKIRNKLVAHADEDTFPIDYFMSLVGITTDLDQAFVVSTVVHVRGFKKFLDMAFFDRVLRHIKACVEAADEGFKRESDLLFAFENSSDKTLARAIDHPELFVKADPEPLLAGRESRFEQEVEMKLTRQPNLAMAENYEFNSYLFQASVGHISLIFKSGEINEIEFDAEIKAG